MREWPPICFDKITSYSLKDRPSKVHTADFGRPWEPGGSFRDWLDRLPRFLAASDLKAVAGRMVKAVQAGHLVLLAMGAHPIKVGLNPVIISLMRQGVLQGLALNGAGIIHDTEIAMVGHTSEDVAAELGTGRFGMAEETGAFLHQVIGEAARQGRGLGTAVGQGILQAGFPHAHLSLLATAAECGLPVTVHVAIGTDIIHFHPLADGAAIGQGSHLDFRIFAGLISRLEGGVYLNLGSAVLLPEVFLKALTLVRNLGHAVQDFTTVNMDFIAHYRPLTNVVRRPTLEGGQGYNLVGHHELMLPLLAAAVLEGLAAPASRG